MQCALDLRGTGNWGDQRTTPVRSDSTTTILFISTFLEPADGKAACDNTKTGSGLQPMGTQDRGLISDVLIVVMTDEFSLPSGVRRHDGRILGFTLPNCTVLDLVAAVAG